SWRMIFFGIAVLAGIVGLILLLFLPETLAVSNRSPIRLRETLSTIVGGLRNTRFMSYALVFALAGSVQIVFGVAAPFLYQERLRFSPAAYGLIALLVGAANLMGEVACSALAQRTTPRQLCFGAWSFLAVGALVMALSGTFSGPGFLAITVASCLSLAGGGTLCPTMYGMGLGLFSRNLGLMGGMISAICYLGISASTAVVAHLPQNTQAPLGWLYVTLGIFVFILLFFSLPRAKEDQATASKPA
ncbi:MAG: MFS transporter, partial [Chthoniobacterales bacterium]